ncbi:transcriptional regulator [Vagococcus martis]|uniref:Transcriptional regulator n=1 Tax=Vagococcus martis TaxID=1768210 RepID=A0A1V4DJL0_9ENTE|nr:helix-turn-helix transcriptional regulator [Vagococcus martis]OPF88777.1 transcriptional regulator [Vagococcus martis]
MNFSKQLKKYRELYGFSQEILAEKIYVTRQTISKWENDKSYPDIHNLLALSILFDITLDELVKGDMRIMKNVVENEKLEKNTKGMLVFIILLLVIGVPFAVVYDGIKALIPFLIFSIGLMYYAIKIEKAKKKHNIKTFREIIAFSEGDTTLEELQKARSTKDNIKEKILVVGAFSVVIVILAIVIKYLTVFMMKFF